MSADGKKRRRAPPPGPPDILYHATTVWRVEQAVERESVDVGKGRKVFMSVDESQAWLVAHRLRGEPRVLFVDATRARRGGVEFERKGAALWQADSIPTQHVLNLIPGFGHQHSAGGIPVWRGPDGPRLALVSCRRGRRCTWEVAKGKLEVGESPEAAAIREVREEMGLDFDLTVERSLGAVRYGFRTPDGSPRLKTMHMFLLAAPEQITQFSPRDSEGIVEVRWFSPREAARLVAHRSLKPLMHRVRWLFEKKPRG